MSDHSFDPAFLRIKQGLDKDLKLVTDKKAELLRLQNEVKVDQDKIKRLQTEIQILETDHRGNLSKLARMEQEHNRHLNNPNIKLPPHH